MKSAAASAPATAASWVGSRPVQEVAARAAAPTAVPEATTAMAVPMAAPPDSPKTNGSASGFRKSAGVLEQLAGESTGAGHHQRGHAEHQQSADARLAPGARAGAGPRLFDGGLQLGAPR